MPKCTLSKDLSMLLLFFCSKFDSKEGFSQKKKKKKKKPNIFDRILKKGTIFLKMADFDPLNTLST